ncbi:hypothetical protein DE146DRAFT_210052 [Phaeosphaeria sp. MPI-PUGE-AT-0046c]|nr:hypothetical protein DE146DRAFT_210052 [Phaeosphaeria sp. MPI-PUGE-AT-0046c]
MDTDMGDITARASDYQGSDENEDDFSIHSSDWATPPHERAAKEAGGFSHPTSALFAKQDHGGNDDILSPSRHLSYSRPTRPRNSAPGPFDSEDEDEGSHFSVSPSPTEGPPHQRSSSDLFVPEDEAVFVIRGETTLNRPENVLYKVKGMEGVKRARDIKNEIEMNIALLQPRENITTSRPDPEEDPEDQRIRTLRNEQKMDWTDISDRLNEERLARGEAATFTSSTVYSRFVRLTAITATPMGEIGFHPKDYAHLHQARMSSKAASKGKGQKRVKDYDNPKELDVNMRQQVSDKEYEELETPEKSEQLMQAVAKVERNFWLLVADEMERSTTRLYSPTALADRYHAI